MLRTGLRVGECIALELSDFQRLTSPDPTLHVYQTWTQGRHEHQKNGVGDRMRSAGVGSQALTPI